MMLRITLIEDEELDSLSDDIQSLGDANVEVNSFLPPENLVLAQILETPADLYIVDYELDTEQKRSGTIAAYRGTTLAARLREVKPEIPIVLLTRSTLDLWTDNQRTVQAEGIFDEILFKDLDLSANNRCFTHKRLVALAQGYHTLRGLQPRSLEELLSSLKTDERGEQDVVQAQPPVDGWSVFEAARWLRSTLLRYPGVLYDCKHAAVSVGISESSFNHEKVRELFAGAEYLGPFCAEQKRWWRHQLFEILDRYSRSPCHSLSNGFEGFRTLLSESLGLVVEPSKDGETGRGPADTVCYVLNVPIRVENSLPYRPDNRPRIMDEARVSFKAIRESNEVDERLLSEADRQIMRKIQRNIHGD